MAASIPAGKTLIHATNEGALPLPRLTASVQSWIAHAAYGQTFRLRSALLADLAFSRA